MSSEFALTLLIGLICAVVGAIVQALIPPNALSLVFSGTPKRKSIVGEWDSWWGPTPDKVRTSYETISITKQRGDRVWGKSTRPDEPDKVWDIEGRCDGDYIQMHYFPAKESRNRDFLDYGCYFLKRKAKGIYVGFSAGFGPSEMDGEDSLSTDYHKIERKPSAGQRPSPTPLPSKR